jgi:cytoskeletal protein RodZ
MNRNQKIALGCGGAGCLGLILIVVVVAVLIASGTIKAPGITSYTNTNNSNRNSNYNSPYNRNSNTNSNTNSSSSSSTMSEDAKHRLYQAAGSTKDSALILRVIRKIGLGDGTGNDHQEFVKAHFVWAKDNFPFILSVNTPEKARAYVDEHIDD